MIQILHYYCRKRHKNIKNSDYRTKCYYLSLLFSLLIATSASFPLLNSRVFSVLGHSFKHHKWSFVLYIIPFSALKISFSKLNLAKYQWSHKKQYIPHVFSYHKTSLQISFYKFFCTNLYQVLLRRFYTERFVYYDLCDLFV